MSNHPDSDARPSESTVQPIAGTLAAHDLRVGVVVSTFHSSVTERLETGALTTLKRHGAREENIQLVHVPGAFEIPLVAQHLAKSGHYDAVICLGAVIRGATPHFDFISAEMSRGIAKASRDTGIPITFGVLTTNTMEEALSRATLTGVNRGADSARTAVTMATLMKALHTREHHPTGFRRP